MLTSCTPLYSLEISSKTFFRIFEAIAVLKLEICIYDRNSILREKFCHIPKNNCIMIFLKKTLKPHLLIDKVTCNFNFSSMALAHKHLLQSTSVKGFNYTCSH